MKEKLITVNGINYIVREDGNIFSTYYKSRTHPIRQYLNSDGYACIKLGVSGKAKNRKNQKVYRVHRIVATAFVPNPYNYPEVDHLDSDRANNNANNLEWVTHKENIIRSHKRGNCKSKAGVNNPKAKLTERDVLCIRLLYDNNIMSQAELADKFECGWSTIHNIVTRLTWAYI